ncbi:MAG: hypothetical protein AB7V14_04515 [Kiritimatiellia bacterium]
MIALRRIPACAALLLLGLPAAAWAWAGTQHVQINRLAGRNVPDDMGAFRAFSRPMVLPGIYPDLWKGSDAEEGARHYFEPDRLAEEIDLLSISSNRLTAFETQIAVRSDEIGVAPWTIVGLLDEMTEAMRTNDWLWAARCGAAMGHYAADVHMPLHCTRNYNGQETWQDGVHTRWESDMTKAFFRTEELNLAPAVYLEDPFRSVMEWVAESYALAPEILKADVIAKRSAGGQIDTEGYYLKLWELTGEIVVARIGDAVADLSSLWYTAWVDAGKPAIPEPFDELPPYSVFSGVGIDAPEVEGPHVSRQKRTYDLVIWGVMIAFGAIVIGSSIHRGIQDRRARKK